MSENNICDGRADKVKGDIRDLYAYYRLTDHQMTNVTLKNKVFRKEKVWFEGHMDWTFIKCQFYEKSEDDEDLNFYFGVPGRHLEEDTRPIVSDDPTVATRPPFGSNGLHFSECEFRKDFEIKDNCNVIFKDCTFHETIDRVLFEDSVRVEFINCEFKCRLEFNDYCEVRFRSCSLGKCKKQHILASGHCNIFLDRCEQTGQPDKNCFVISDDTHFVVHDKEEGDTADLSRESVCCSKQSDLSITPGTKDWKAPQVTFIVDNYSTMKFYKQGELFSPLKVFKITGNSKLELRGIKEVMTPLGPAIELRDESELYTQDVVKIQAIVSNAVDLSDGCFWRGRDLGQVMSIIGHALYASDSQARIQEFIEFTTVIGNCVQCLSSKLDFHEGQQITSKLGVAVYKSGMWRPELSDDRRSTYKEIGLIKSDVNYAIQLVDEGDMYTNNVEIIKSSALDAIYLNKGYLEVITTKLIKGLLDGVKSYNGSRFFTRDVETIKSETLIAAELYDTLHDVRRTELIWGLMGGWWPTDSKGVLKEIGTIESPIEKAVNVVNFAGPTEYEDIDLIFSPIQIAFNFIGHADQARIVDVREIHSIVEKGLRWDQSGGGQALFKDVDLIHSIIEIGAWITLGAKCHMEMVDIKDVHSIIQIGKKVEVGVQSIFRCYDGGEIYSVINVGLDWTSYSEAKSGFHTYDKIYSQIEDAIQINFAEKSDNQMYKVKEISSELADAIDGSCAGRFTVVKTDLIKAPLGQIVAIDGGSTGSLVRFDEIQKMESQTPPAAGVEITSIETIELEDIEEITVETTPAEVVKLEGTGAGYGTIKVLDCKSITGQTCENVLKVGKALLSDLVGVKAACELTGDTVKDATLSVTDTNLYLRNYSKIAADGGEGHAIDLLDSEGKGLVMKVQAVDDIKGDKDGIRYKGDGILHLIELPKVAGKKVEENAIFVQGDSFAEVHFLKVVTETSKGKTVGEKVQFHITSSEINGDFETTDCTGESHDSKYNTSVKCEGTRLQFYRCDVALNAQPGEAQDFEFDEQSSIYAFRTPVTGAGDFLPDGVFHGDVETISVPFKGGDGVALLNLSEITDVLETRDTLLFNRVSVNGETTLENSTFIGNNVTFGTDPVTSARSSLLWNRTTIVKKFTLDSDNIIANTLYLGDDFEMTNYEAGIFNKVFWYQGAKDLDIKENAALIFNHTQRIKDLNISNNSGVIFNQSIGLEGDVEILADNGVILNRVDGSTNDSLFTLDGTSGLLVSWVKGGDLEILSQGGSSVSGLMGSYVHMTNDVTIEANTSACITALRSDGQITIDTEGALAVIGGAYVNPVGEGVILEMGPAANTPAPRLSSTLFRYHGETYVAGLHIHANSDGTKNAAAITNILSEAFCLAGDRAEGKSESFIYGDASVIIEGRNYPTGEAEYDAGVRLRQAGRQTGGTLAPIFPSDQRYQNILNLWSRGPGDDELGINIKSQLGLTPTVAGFVEINCGHFEMASSTGVGDGKTSIQMYPYQAGDDFIGGSSLTVQAHSSSDLILMARGHDNIVLGGDDNITATCSAGLFDIQCLNMNAYATNDITMRGDNNFLRYGSYIGDYAPVIVHVPSHT